MKSGPTLNACVRRPRRRSVSSRPSVRDVLPTPVEAPATTTTRIVRALEFSVAPGARCEALRAGEALAGIERGGAQPVFAAECGGQASTDRLVGRAAIAAHAARWKARNR